MGLGNSSGRFIYLNIKDGRIYRKEKGGEPIFHDNVSGIITKVDFKVDTYQGKNYLKTLVTIVDGEERFLLQFKAESGYFRGFCNSLKSGEPTKHVKLIPNSKPDGEKNKTTMFVEQNGKALKHFYTKDNTGDLPQLEKESFRGEEYWDGRKQLEFWKNWLISIAFISEEEAVILTSKQGAVIKKDNKKEDVPGYTNDDDLPAEPADDLPF